MSYEKRWNKLEELGEGGQGKVYRAIDLNRFDIEGLYTLVRESVENLSRTERKQETIWNHLDKYKFTLHQLIEMENPNHHYALKVLHDIKDARDSVRAKERIKKEVAAMMDIKHPNLLSLIDYDNESEAPEWYVSKYYPKGSLSKNLGLFTGNFVKALKSIRPLVDGVAKLHDKGYVHRDIKPQNVFMDNQNNLVLGDFGLIFFEDEQKTRLSDDFENVGSRDWMPGWAMGLKIEEVKPTFDVFALGKLLWAMVSDMPILQLWYYDKPQFDIINKFSGSPYIELSDKIFKRCIVEEEKDCLPHASALLEIINQALNIIDKNAIFYREDNIKYTPTMPCNICGIGLYSIVHEREKDLIRQLNVKIFSCNKCGNIQFFRVGR